MDKGNLTGTFHVRMVRAAFMDGHKWLPRTKYRAELRRHAIKLRYWPSGEDGDRGIVTDLDWEYIKSLPGMKIGELRIDDKIGDCDNLRVIFWVAPANKSSAMPTIWILAVLQKKRDDFTNDQISLFKARKRNAEARLSLEALELKGVSHDKQRSIGEKKNSG